MPGKRYGRLTILSTLTVPEIRLIEIFKLIEFLPFHIASSYMEKALLYSGYSTLFRELEEGDIIPNYTLTITVNDVNWPISVTVKEN